MHLGVTVCISNQVVKLITCTIMYHIHKCIIHIYIYINIFVHVHLSNARTEKTQMTLLQRTAYQTNRGHVTSSRI